MWESGVLGGGNPISLLHTMWYLNTKLLGLRGNHESCQLRWGDMELKYLNDGTEFLEYNERLTKTRGGNSAHLRPFSPKLFPNLQNTERCPIQLYKEYSRRRPANMNNKDSKPLASPCFRHMVQMSACWCKFNGNIHENNDSPGSCSRL